MSREKWKSIAEEIFQTEAHRLDPLRVLERIRDTNTCSNLDSPIQVWIDESGWYDVLVYDQQDHE